MVRAMVCLLELYNDLLYLQHKNREQKKLLRMPSAAVIHKNTESCILMSSLFLSLLLFTSTSSSGSISINSLSIDTPILPDYNDNVPLSNYFLLQRATAMEDYSGDDAEASSDDTGDGDKDDTGDGDKDDTEEDVQNVGEDNDLEDDSSRHNEAEEPIMKHPSLSSEASPSIQEIEEGVEQEPTIDNNMLSETAPTGDSTASKQTTQTAATVTEIGSRGRDSIKENNQDYPTTINQDGTIATIYPDGTKIVKRPDGTTKTSHPEGSEIIDKPGFNGYTIIKKPNGTTITVDVDGNIDKTNTGSSSPQS